jgi:hypothetical protein
MIQMKLSNEHIIHYGYYISNCKPNFIISSDLWSKRSLSASHQIIWSIPDVNNFPNLELITCFCRSQMPEPH